MQTAHDYETTKVREKYLLKRHKALAAKEDDGENGTMERTDRTPHATGRAEALRQTAAALPVVAV